jgi:hypothetical protein
VEAAVGIVVGVLEGVTGKVNVGVFVSAGEIADI